jgi:anti-sigma factor RsiW
MTPVDHTDLYEQLAVYSLDALPADEVVQLERHLADCPRCRAELASLREVAGLLGNAGATAPGAAWEHIATELGITPPVEAPVVSFPPLTRRKARTPLRGVVLGVAAVLMAVVGLLSYRVVDLNNRVGQLQSALSDRGVGQLVAFALADPDHRSIELTASGSVHHRALVVVLPDGRAYWVDDNLAPLPAGSTYQLWALSRGKAVSLGVLGRAPQDVAFRVEATMTELLVTAEPSGGVPAPTSSVLVAGSVIL